MNARPLVKAPVNAAVSEEVGFECDAQYLGMVVTNLGFPNEAELTTQAFVSLSTRVQDHITHFDTSNGAPPRSNVRLVATPTAVSFQNRGTGAELNQLCTCDVMSFKKDPTTKKGLISKGAVALVLAKHRRKQVIVAHRIAFRTKRHLELYFAQIRAGFQQLYEQVQQVQADPHTAPSDPVSSYLEVDAKPASQAWAEGPGDMTVVTQLLLTDTSEEEC
jgi:hypothetical protein